MFYVYEHWRTDTNLPFYVGKGRKGRAFVMSKRNKHHMAVQEKLKLLGFKVEIRIVASDMNEADAFLLEIETIKKYRSAGVDLTNKTNGGEGVSGLAFSDEHRRKIGVASRGRKRPMSAENRKKMSERMKGKQVRLGAKLSKETKEKISISNMGKFGHNKGKSKSDEIKKKISDSVSLAIAGANNPFYGKKHSEDTKNKISEVQKKRIAENGAWVPTDEQKKAKSEVIKEWHRKKREEQNHASC